MKLKKLLSTMFSTQSVCLYDDFSNKLIHCYASEIPLSFMNYEVNRVYSKSTTTLGIEIYNVGRSLNA